MHKMRNHVHSHCEEGNRRVLLQEGCYSPIPRSLDTSVALQLKLGEPRLPVHTANQQPAQGGRRCLHTRGTKTGSSVPHAVLITCAGPSWCRSLTVPHGFASVRQHCEASGAASLGHHPKCGRAGVSEELGGARATKGGRIPASGSG